MQEDRKKDGPDWAGHLQVTKDAPTSLLLLEALPLVAAKRQALDLGGGGLKDTRFLLSQGFERITVVDGELTVVDLAKDLPQEKVEIIISAFETFSFPESEYDLVTAQFSLPFNPPETFKDVFEKMKGSLKKGGIFCGQLFATGDEWNVPGSGMTFHTEEEARALLSGMEIIQLTEKIRDGKLASGKTKHWHLFNLIARK